jgi:ketosteroid isomerase-like protein
MDVAELVAIEEIRQVRHRYSWCYDTGDLEGLVAVFTEDAVCSFGPYGTWTGSAEIRDGFQGSFRDVGVPGVTMHAVTNSLVRVDGDHATGQWFLLDLILGAGDENPLRIVAHYDDEYRRGEDGWRISRTDIRFLWTADTGRVSSGDTMQKVTGT